MFTKFPRKWFPFLRIFSKFNFNYFRLPNFPKFVIFTYTESSPFRNLEIKKGIISWFQYNLSTILFKLIQNFLTVFSKLLKHFNVILRNCHENVPKFNRCVSKSNFIIILRLPNFLKFLTFPSAQLNYFAVFKILVSLLQSSPPILLKFLKVHSKFFVYFSGIPPKIYTQKW